MSRLCHYNRVTACDQYNPPVTPFELTLQAGQLIAGLRNHPAGSADLPRVLCLHGWLDNAASFLPLAAHLDSVDLVAIDLPGHGHSSWTSPGNYTLFEMAVTARRVMHALGWSSCHLMGHSLGGCIAPLLAVADPVAMTSLLLIEASGPLSEEAEALPTRLARAMNDRLATDRFASRVFASADDAVTARLKAASLHRVCAQLIVERQIETCRGGWRWRFDPALRGATPQYHTEAQVLAVLSALTVPILTVVAENGYLAGRQLTAERLARLHPQNQHTNARRTLSVRLPGHHHLHMDTPESVAQVIRRFLIEARDTPG